MLIGEQVAGPPDAGLHLIEDEEQSVIVAELAQRAQELGRHHAHPALAHDRLDQDRGGRRTDRALGRFEIGKRHLVKAVEYGAEAVEIFLLAAGRQRRQGAAVEGAFEGNDAETFRLAARRLVFARHLDGAFHRLGAGIGEKHDIGEACLAEPLGQPLGLRDSIEIGNVPQLRRLLGDRRDQMRMRVAERVDRDARGEVEVALTVLRDKPCALTPLEREIDPCIGRQQVRCPSSAHVVYDKLAETKCAASPGGTEWYSIAARWPVNTVESGRECVPSAASVVRFTQVRRNMRRKVWTQTRSDSEGVDVTLRTLAPDSRHNVAF